jgi:transposase
MLTWTGAVKIYLAAEPVDLRRGFDGLASATREILRRDPLSGHVFAYVNRRRNRMKLLLWQPGGFLIVYKRLEVGTFRFARVPRMGERHVEIEASELVLMMEGIDLGGSRKRKRWVREEMLASDATI